MAKISIRNHQVRTVIGAHSYEQHITQQLMIDLSFSADIDRAANTDLLSDTQDYSIICGSITEFANNTCHRLLETFAKNLSDHLKKQFQLSELKLSVTKKPKDLANVSVIVEL